MSDTCQEGGIKRGDGWCKKTQDIGGVNMGRLWSELNASQTAQNKKQDSYRPIPELVGIFARMFTNQSQSNLSAVITQEVSVESLVHLSVCTWDETDRSCAMSLPRCHCHDDASDTLLTEVSSKNVTLWRHGSSMSLFFAHCLHLCLDSILSHWRWIELTRTSGTGFLILGQLDP